jgi:hypothetical protein
MKAIGVFLVFGGVLACAAGISLTRPGTVLERMWALNSRAFQELAPLGPSVGLLFLVLAVALMLAGAGWLKRRRWGWQLAVAIIGTQVLGNCIQIFPGRVTEGIVGVTIAGALLFYITRGRVRRFVYRRDSMRGSALEDGG